MNLYADINFGIEIIVLGMVCHNKALDGQHNINFLVIMTQPLSYYLFMHWCPFQALDYSHKMSCTSVLCAYKVDGAQTKHPNTFHNRYRLIMWMSTLVTSAFWFGFGSSTNKTLSPINFKYGIQIRHALVVHWNPVSFANKNHFKLC